MLSFQIVEKPAMILAGVTLENVKSNQECPKLWEKLHKQYNPSKLKEKGIQQAIGICKTQPDFRFDYSATYQVETSVQAPKGLELLGSQALPMQSFLLKVQCHRVFKKHGEK